MMARVRVLQVVTRLVVRGVPRHVLDLATRLDRERFEVEVLAGRGEPSEGSLWEEAEARGVTTHRVEALQRAVHPLRDWQAYREIRRAIRRGGYDIVHTHISKAGVLGRQAARDEGVPLVVHTYHGPVQELETGGVAGRVLRAAERRAARQADALIAVSQELQEHLLARGIGRREQYAVVPNGVDLAHYDRDLGWERPAAATGRPTVLAVGSLTPEKGFDVLLEAARTLALRYPQLQVCIVGDGPLRERLQGQSRQLGLNGTVHFAGNVADVRPWLAVADLFALPSRSEGTARSLLEAMAMGVPVVASRVGGTPEIVTGDGVGRLVAPGDVDGLVREADELLGDAGSRTRVGEGGRARVLGAFGLDGMVERVERIYDLAEET